MARLLPYGFVRRNRTRRVRGTRHARLIRRSRAHSAVPKGKGHKTRRNRSKRRTQTIARERFHARSV